MLRPVEATPALDWLAAQCVATFEDFAALATINELEREGRQLVRAKDWSGSPLGAPASNLQGPNFTPPFPAYPSSVRNSNAGGASTVEHLEQHRGFDVAGDQARRAGPDAVAVQPANVVPPNTDARAVECDAPSSVALRRGRDGENVSIGLSLILVLGIGLLTLSEAQVEPLVPYAVGTVLGVSGLGLIPLFRATRP